MTLLKKKYSFQDKNRLTQEVEKSKRVKKRVIILIGIAVLIILSILAYPFISNVFLSLGSEPYVKTLDAKDITNHSAGLNMHYNLKDYVGHLDFKYKEKNGEWLFASDQLSTESFTNSTGEAYFGIEIVNLSSNTEYYYKAMLAYDNKTIFGETIYFKTLN